MGTVDQFKLANQHLKANLGYRLDPEHSDEFRKLLALGGYKRFLHAVEIVKLQHFQLRASARHEYLIAAMKVLLPYTPETKHLRNPAAESVRKQSLELDQQVQTAIALDD